MLKTIKRILIVNPFGIGDVLFSTPLISNLKYNYPDLYLGYLCNQRVKELVELNSKVNKLFIWEKDYFRKLWSCSKIKAIKEFASLLKEIKKENFDLVIDLSLNPEYSFFLSLIGIKKRIGYDFKKRGRFLTKKIKFSGYSDKPIPEYYLDLLKFVDSNAKITDKNLVFPIGESDIAFADSLLENNNLKGNNFLVGVIPGGGASWGKDAFYKQWDTPNFAAVADGLIQEFKVRIIIMGDSRDYTLCQAVKNKMKNEAILSCGNMSLRQFAAVIKRCNLVICNDGGPLHVAVSQGVKTVSIFGPVDELVYGPYPPDSNHIVVSKKLDCRPCYKKFRLSPCPQRYCLTTIIPKDVLTTAKKLVF